MRAEPGGAPIRFTPAEIAEYYRARVPGLKQQSAGEWRAPCPIHQGKDLNFSLNPETGQWFCHSQCGRGGDLFDLEEALHGGDFPTRKAEIFRVVGRSEPSKPAKPSTGGWREEARYPYTDESGGLLYEVVRYRKADGAKTFVQMRPSGVERAGTTDPERSGGVPAGGLVIGLDKGKYMPDDRAARANGKPTWKRVSDQLDFDGAEYRFRECPRVPYRLPEVLAADTVFLPEGEKDVATLEGWGLVASCNPGGSGSSHLYTAWAGHFRGRHIVILPDNDAPGRKHAAAVAGHLLPVAASLRVVELPGLPAKGDVTNWKEAGGTGEQLLAFLAEVAPLDAPGLAALRDRWGLADTPTERPTRAQVGEEWPTPEPLAESLPPVLPFDERLLPEAFRPLVADVTERMQVPMDYPAVAITLCLSGVVNRRALVQPKALDSSWVVVPNLWGGIIAPPGFMKSPVISAITRPLTQIQAEWRREHEAELAEYASAKEEFELRRAAWKEQYKAASKKGRSTPDRPGEEPAEPTLRRLIVNDATFEALHQTMNENPAGLLVIRDELVGWWSQLDRAGREGERAFCLQAWNGDTGHTIDRIGRGTIHVEHCCMSMLGGIQPGRLRPYLVDALEDGPTNDGLIQRFQLLVWPDTAADWQYIDRSPDATSELRAEAVMRRLAEIDPEDAPRFRFAADAQELFVEWLAELEAKVRGEELHPALVSHLSKYRKLMPALALLFELADHAAEGFAGFEGGSWGDRPEISLAQAQRAAAWCEYLESHARRVYSCVVTPQLRAARELAEKIRARKVGADGFFSCREVYLKGWSGLDSPEAVKLAAEVLEDAGWVRSLAGESSPLGGRPSNRYEVNPRVWEKP
jgi:putative DNA primase/helicase